MTNSVKTAYIDGVYELNQISYVHLLKMTQHTTFVYVISWNSDKIVDSIYVMCWTALIAESIEKRCQDFYMKVSLSSLIENYNCLLFDHNILIWTKLYIFFFDGRDSNPEPCIYYPLSLNCVLRLLRCLLELSHGIICSSVRKELINYYVL